MLLYLWFKFVFVLVCMEKIKSCLKGGYVRKKKPPKFIHWLFILFNVLLCSLDSIRIL